MIQDDGELAAPPPAAVTEAVEEAPPHVQPGQQTTVPQTADEDEEGQAVVTPESPVGQLGSPSSSVGAPPPAPTPTPNLSPREERKAAVDRPGADSPAAARPGSASATASRTICLRTLRGSNSSGALSSLAGWGRTAVGAAPAAGGAEQGAQGAPPETSAAAPGQAGMVAAAVGVGGGLGVLPSANKVVDLREVKKVRPGPLASAAAAPVPADDSDGLEEGGGPVKIDISAGKRMIEFQLKQNAADEKREAARLKSERDRADAAAAEGSQRMLAQVNARIEAQRRGGGGVLGSRPSGSLADQDAASGIGQSQLRNLAEKHGIVVRFVDDGAASGFAQVRALARAHGIRVQILGQDGDGGRGCFGEHGEESGAPLGGDGGDKAAGSDVATPPPILSSLRTRATPARRSPSPVPETLVKAPPRKIPAAPAGGMFSGPARMMRRALAASGGCVPSAKDVSPEVSRVESASFKTSPVSDGDGDGDGNEVPTQSGAASEDSSPAASVLLEGAQRTKRAASTGSKGSVVRPRPGSGGSAGSVDAISNGISKGDVVAGSDSRGAKSEGESCSTKGEGIDAAAAAATAATAAPGGNTLRVSGRKRREVPGDANQVGGKERRGEHAAGATSRRSVGGGDMGGGSGGSAVGGRMESRLGNRNGGLSGDERRGTPSARESKEVASSRIQNGVPKRMRLVAPSGLVVSQTPNTPSTQKSGRRASTGAMEWGPGNNNLFKGAMAGIMGRGKRPAP